MKTHTFESYRDTSENVRMKREDGILEVALHARGGSTVVRTAHRLPGVGARISVSLPSKLAFRPAPVARALHQLSGSMRHREPGLDQTVQ
jgi:hypothetical protein